MGHITEMIHCAVVHFCRSEAAPRLKLLQSTGWLGGQTLVLKVQFTLYSPAPNLFTSVTMLAERSPTGTLLPSAKVQSAQVYHSPAIWDYVVMVFQVRCKEQKQKYEYIKNHFFHISLMLFLYCSPTPAPLHSYFSAAPVQSDVIFMATRLFQFLDRTQQLAGSESLSIHSHNYK